MDPTMEQHYIPGGHYGFSAVGIDELGASEYTLVTIAVDVSGSVCNFKNNMEKALKEVIQACTKSPRADNLLIRLTTFSDDVQEVHGFKMLGQINSADYDNCLKIRSLTALYDASENSIAAATTYAKQLIGQDFTINAIVIVITDGCDNASKLNVSGVKKALKEAVRTEDFESIVSILIGVGVDQDDVVKTALNDFKTEVGFTQFVKTDDATAKTLAKLAAFISQSISSQSKALGTGQVSQPLTF
jgi:hypothetical protein